MSKVELFLLPSPIHPNSYIFFVPVVCWNFFTGLLSIHKDSLVHELQTMANRKWSQFMGHYMVYRWDWVLYAYYPMHRWVILFLGFLAYGAGSHSSHKGIFNCG